MLTYYTNFSDNPDLFDCWGYSAPNNNFLDSGSGAKLERFVKPVYPYTYSKLSDFKMYAGAVYTARSTINTSSIALAVALGGVVISWPTVIGALTGGAAAAAAAYQIYVASNDSKAAMANAYNVLNGWSTGVNT